MKESLCKTKECIRIWESSTKISINKCRQSSKKKMKESSILDSNMNKSYCSLRSTENKRMSRCISMMKTIRRIRTTSRDSMI
jgi:hypothetical protein